MEEILERPKGVVDFTWIVNDEEVKSDTRNNAVVENAKTLIARALGGDTAYLIDTIEVYLGSTLLAADTTTVSYPSAQQVRFNALFYEVAFSGDFDKVILKNSVNGNFSEITGFTYNKSADAKLAIGWTITPN